MSHPLNAAILFEPNGYVMSGPRLMGRHAAGAGFLRAAVRGRQGEALWACTPHRASADVFGRLVREIDPSAETRWLPVDRLELLAERGTLYVPDPGLAEAAQLRLRAGPASYSICGVTHTTATDNAMRAVCDLLTAPVMPWDALVCTSNAVLSTVVALIERQRDYLQWRLGPAKQIALPQLPVIPLGVHASDFVFTADERAAARRALGIAEDEVVGLFLGRLSFHAKAHPHVMYLGLQRAAERTGKKITLIQCGWFANAPIEAAFKNGAAMFSPDLRALYTEGKDARQRRQSWAAADLFISLSDNIQETFGLSPIEAMAAGLPLVVTDWNGYKDTVRDGVDGFRIPTWMPAPGFGEDFARLYEAGSINYDIYCGVACQTVSVDLGLLTDRLATLVLQPELRHRLGEAGKIRARELYDWQVVYARYQELWAELNAMRQAARQGLDCQPAAPSAAAAGPDPFAVFAHYPTQLIQATTRVARAAPASEARYRELIAHPLFTYADRHLPPAELADLLLHALEPAGQSVEALAERLHLDLAATLRAVSILAKMGLIRLCRADGTA